LAGVCEPEDLAQNVWLITIPRLKDLQPRDGRLTPVLMSFLSSALLKNYRNLLSKRLAKPIGNRGGGDTSIGDPMAALPAKTSTAAAKAVRNQRVAELHRAIERLPRRDREILILHAIEQLPFPVIAKKLGMNTNTLRTRYHRSLQELKSSFPQGMIAELEEEG
jgi:RNA polymerase sigma factor (sigma-70 family)